MSSVILQRSLRALCAGAAAFLLAACPTVPTTTATMQEAPNLDVTADQLQLQAFAMGHQVNGMIARAADSIASTSTDFRVRRDAMRWKLNATPLVQEAALRNDPLVAVVDLAAFTTQQTAYFSTGDGRTMFGALQPVAVDASRRMQSQVEDLMARSMKHDELPARFTERLGDWAAKHPISGPDLERESILGSDWKALGATEKSLSGTVGSMDRTLRLLGLRLSYLNETLSAQLRWNAQLLADEMFNSPRSDSILRPGAGTIRAVGDLAAGAPDLLARERVAVLAAVDRQRVLALADVDRQRVETLHALTGERVALTATLDSERVLVLAALDKERVAALRGVDSVAQAQIGHAEAAATRLLWEGVLGAVIVVGALTVGGMFVVRQRRA